jgi:uncharacterized phage protein gp47/JayE
MFAIPTFKELVERSRQAFRINLPGSDAWVWPNNINPTAKVIGGMTHEVFGFADYIQKQHFALTADTENLDLHGEEFGLSRSPAAPAVGWVDVAVASASTIEVGAVFRRADGVEYFASNGGSITGAGTMHVAVIAATDGKNTIAIPGAPLQIVSGLTGDLAALADVAAEGINGGTDVEDDESFRARILFRKRNPPHGGTAADYVMWASQMSGVSRVYIERLWAGPGTVRVFPLLDDLYADGIPQPADVDRIAEHIDTLRPAGAIVSVAAAMPVPVNIEIKGLSPNTTTVQEAVLAELRSAFRRYSRVCGNDKAIGSMPYLASPTSFSRSWIWQAVANASGEERHSIVTPAADVPLISAQIATLGTVTFTA